MGMIVGTPTHYECDKPGCAALSPPTEQMDARAEAERAGWFVSNFTGRSYCPCCRYHFWDATPEQKPDALALAAAVLRAVPDATPERVEALLRVGLAVERLEGSEHMAEIWMLTPGDDNPPPFSVRLFINRDDADLRLENGEGIGATLPEAVAAALGDTP